MEKKEKDTRKLKLKSILISEPIPLPEIIKMLWIRTETKIKLEP